MNRKWLPMLALLASFPAFAGNGAVDAVQKTTDKLFNLIQENRVEYERNPQELEQVVREVLLPRLDSDYTGRLVLGRHARGLTSEQIKAFTDALANVLIDRYATQLLEFESREQLEILPLSGEGSEARTRVQTRVLLVSGQSVPVDYIMHLTDAGWQVFDVVVEGISYVITFRSQFDEELSQHSFEEVLARIQRGEVEVTNGESTHG